MSPVSKLSNNYTKFYGKNKQRLSNDYGKLEKLNQLLKYISFILLPFYSNILNFMGLHQSSVKV